MNKPLSFNFSHQLAWSSLEPFDYDLVKLSKMQARRMTKLAKITVDMALRVSEGIDISKVVFVSRHGEVSLAYELINSILSNETPSPTKFSQSTHNAIAGLFSIQGKCTAPMTAISAGSDSLIMGFINSALHVSRNPEDKVLFIFSDGQLPSIYRKDDPEINDQDIVIVGVVGKGNHFQIEQINSKLKNKTLDMPFEFCRFITDAGNKIELSGEEFTLVGSRG